MYSILKQDFFGVQLTLNNLFFKKDKRVNLRAYTEDLRSLLLAKHSQPKQNSTKSNLKNDIARRLITILQNKYNSFKLRAQITSSTPQENKNEKMRGKEIKKAQLLFAVAFYLSFQEKLALPYNKIRWNSKLKLIQSSKEKTNNYLNSI